MLTRTQLLPAGLCVLLAASLIALPGCGSRSKKKEAKVDKAPTVTAKSSDEVAAEKAASEGAPAAKEDMARGDAAPAPEAASPAPEPVDTANAPRGGAFEEAGAAPRLEEPAPAPAPNEMSEAPAAPAEEPPPAPVKRSKGRKGHGKAKAYKPAVASGTEETAPAAAEAADSGDAAGGKGYTVVAGDSIYKIAKSHGVSAKKLMAANHITDPKKLKVGQKLVLP